MKYHSKESDYGFNGLINIFNQKEIDMNDWVFKQLDKERGDGDRDADSKQLLLRLKKTKLAIKDEIARVTEELSKLTKRK